MGPSILALLAAGAAGLVGAVVRQDVKISPELEPKSDKKFFDKDFPWDKRPAADKHYVFDHPYPAVQDTGDFDKDFTKDENNDGGKWAAQMDYDTLRSKIRKAERKMAAAKEKLEKEEGEYNSAKDKFSKTSGAATSAEALRKKAEQEAAEAAAKVNKLEGASGAKGVKAGGAVGDAVKKVKDEMDDLENCKKELTEAKQRLKDLMKQKEEMDIKVKKEEEEKKKKHEEEKVVKVEEKKKKDVVKKVADEEVAKKVEVESIWKKKIAKEQSEHSEATKSYEQELEDVKRTEAQLKEAEKNLRKFRRSPHVDGNGGVYNVPDEKGSARLSSVAGLSFILAVAAAL